MDKKYLCIGHVCMDAVEDGFVLGGTASYAAQLANTFGFQASILTSYGEDFLFENEFKGIEILNVFSENSTVFKNIYTENGRTQSLLNRANDLKKKHLFRSDFSAVHFCPIADEVDFELISNLKKENILTVATPQGWMRQWDKEGKVFYKPMDWSKLSDVDFVIISEEDVPNLETEIESIVAEVSQLIVTRGEGAASFFSMGNETKFPAHKTVVKDATGAGDVFATAFTICFLEMRDINQSMKFANYMASICVAHNGLTFLKSIKNIDVKKVCENL